LEQLLTRQFLASFDDACQARIVQIHAVDDSALAPELK
jgi:hypothetical protein